MSVPDYTIRTAQRADLDRIVELLLALQDHIEASNPDLWRLSVEARANLKGQLAARLEARGVCSLVADHDQDGVVGVVFGRILSSNRYEPSRAGSVDQLFVRPDHRRSGVARRLLAGLCRFFDQEGASDLSLRYVEGNQEAADFWMAAGFSPRIVTAGARLATVQCRLRQEPES
jgi:GNAT superfamily N-acetyltransferase